METHTGGEGGGSTRPWLTASVLTLWLASALSLLVAQAGGLLVPPRPHSDVPGDDPWPTLAILDGCRRLLGRDDRLWVVYSEEDGVHQYLAYRLPYVLYPTLVESTSYKGEGVAEVRAAGAVQGPTHLLILATGDAVPEGATLEARLGAEARLFRLTGSR